MKQKLPKPTKMGVEIVGTTKKVDILNLSNHKNCVSI